ncbi:uncharacterized protein LOC111382477 [Olea europaea var. sylvestris]|uniref:uncharacterized protein LOC111382477 n=1 Tax=Olea europaea var. sylvestris TaxID=158386 RepID=UPI000C1CEFA9|nr:uncharacterized protein LOC111382477 [Olea europaea var. sylvestris]
MSLSAFSVILKQNQLAGDNYMDWKHNLMFVLIVEKLDFVFEEECPEEPTETTGKSKRTVYDKWIAADKMARCYILTSMSNVLQQKLENQETSYNKLESLKGMFGHQSRRARFEAICTLQNICMKPGMLVKDYMLTMIHFNVAKNLVVSRVRVAMLMLQLLAPLAPSRKTELERRGRDLIKSQEATKSPNQMEHRKACVSTVVTKDTGRKTTLMH